MTKKGFKKSLFPVLLGGFMLIIVGNNFYRYYIIKNYSVHVFVKCDPEKHSCFTADPDTADPAFQNKFYAKVEMLSTNAPACLEEHTCEDFSCDELAGPCNIEYCSSDTISDGENCVGLME
jgi:hypothetical protein